MADLLTPVVPSFEWHPGFRALLEYAGHGPARRLIRELYSTFVDRDGNFVQQFQTGGFDQRTWELFLYALLRDMGAAFDWSNNAPDFVFTFRGVQLAIEATTANPAGGGPVAQGPPEARPEVERWRQLEHVYPIRLGSALYSKLKGKYWDLPQVRGRPFIIAIQDFHEPGSLHHTDAALWRYLYAISGTWHFDESGVLIIDEKTTATHENGAKVIPSGFFSLPDAEYISAVMFGNTGTIAKFNRMGFLTGYSDDTKILMVRSRLCYDHTPNSATPAAFSYMVGHPLAPPETWGQGLSVYHNPRALLPLPHDLLPLAYHFHDGRRLRSLLPDFHPLWSQTAIFVEKAERLGTRGV